MSKHLYAEHPRDSIRPVHVTSVDGRVTRDEDCRENRDPADGTSGFSEVTYIPFDRAVTLPVEIFRAPKAYRLKPYH